MFWETSLIHTITHSADQKEQYPKNGRVAPRRRRAVSTSLPLKTLGFSPEYLNLDSLFNYLPATPRLFSHPPKLAGARPSAPRTSIHSLPTELLCLVFDSYLSPSSDDSEPDTDALPNGFFSVFRDCVRTPIPLTHVCRHWRRAAIGHRKLWSNITFALADGDDDDKLALEIFARGKLQLLRLFLARARDTPLSIAFAASTSHEGLVFEALQYICRYSHLWKDLRLELNQVHGARVFLDQLASIVSRGSRFSALQSLHLELVVDDEEKEVETEESEEALLKSCLVIKDIYGILLWHSPILTDITLDDLFFVWAESADYSICPSYFPRCDYDTADLVPWSQLKNLTITCESISARKVLKICSKASNLESLKVWRVGYDGASLVDDYSCSLPQSRITLPELRSLDVTLLSEPEQLFSTLSLPALEQVEVDVQSLRVRLPAGPPNRRTTSLESLLAPINGVLDVDGAPARRVDVHCKVNTRCLEETQRCPNERVVEGPWMEANGLRALAGKIGRRVVKVYKH